ncbi:MAG: right-handed parallel beta-helix repeat-containing protein [Patescibacteria group bacterium]
MPFNTKVKLKSRIGLKAGLLVLGLVASGALLAFALAYVEGLEEVTPAAPTVTYQDISGACPGQIWGNVRLVGDLAGASNCLIPMADNLIIDGNGKTATVTSGDAVNIFDRANITVRNLNSNRGIGILGDSADNVVIEYSTFSGISVYAADDAVIRNNTINGGLVVSYWFPDNNAAERATISGNTITGSGTRFIDIVGYGNSSTVYAPISPGSPEAESLRRCPLTQHTVTNNIITNTIDSTADNPLTMYLRCGRGNVVSGNTIRATGEAQGLFLRDGANFNAITNNAVWVNKAIGGTRGALAVTSGNEGADFKGYPSNNTFSGNVIRADAAHALWLQAPADNNLYANNVVWSRSGFGSQLAIGQGNTFDHNTFVTGTPGLAVRLASGSAPGDNTITNNIFSHEGGDTLAIDGVAGYDGYVGNGNLLFNRSGSARFFGTMNLNQWKTMSGEGTKSKEGDPLFVDAGNGDFSLNTASPARGAGTDGSDIGAKPYTDTTIKQPPIKRSPPRAP